MLADASASDQQYERVLGLPEHPVPVKICRTCSSTQLACKPKGDSASNACLRAKLGKSLLDTFTPCVCMLPQKHGKSDAALEPERTTEHAGIYATACKRVAQDAGLPVVDVWTALQVPALHEMPAFVAIAPIGCRAFTSTKADSCLLKKRPVGATKTACCWWSLTMAPEMQM